MCGRVLKGPIKALFRQLPRSNGLYSLFKGYVDRFNGEEDIDPTTNGEYRLLRRCLGSCQVVFDVGANVGDWARYALSVNPNIDIHCFEPSRATFDRLDTVDFGKGRVVRNNWGLSNQNGQAMLQLFEQGSGMNSLYARHGLEGRGIRTQAASEQISLQTFDEYCDQRAIERVDFVKIDVEGHELQVLQGMGSSLRAGRVGVVQFEYGGAYIDARVLLKDVFDYFEPLPYRLHKILPDRLQLHERYDQRLENLRYQNWLAVHQSTRFLL